MSATRDHCKAQVKRLAVAPLLVPTNGDTALEWVMGLMRHCQSNEHATLVMTLFLDSATESRNPLADIVAIARRTAVADEPPAGCPACDLGPDPTTGEQRWMAHVSGERNGVGFAKRCSCPRGQWYLARDPQNIRRVAPHVAGMEAPRAVTRPPQRAESSWVDREDRDDS